MKNTRENDKQYPRLVSWSYYPASIFNKNDKEQLVEIYLNDPAGEEVLNTGLLPALGFIMNRDPYFTIKRTDGKTKRAASYGHIANKFRKKYPELENKLKNTDKKLLNFGEYIFIKLPYISNYVNPIVSKEKWFNEQYIKKEFFNEELIKELIEYKPLALFNHKEIIEYQKEKLPAFLRALSLFNEELYKKATKGTDFEEKEINYKGLKAKLSTLKPGKVLYKYDLSRKEFTWDGELLSQTAKLDDGSTLLIKPTDDSIVQIIDNNTVTNETEFV